MSASIESNGGAPATLHTAERQAAVDTIIRIVRDNAAQQQEAYRRHNAFTEYPDEAHLRHIASPDYVHATPAERQAARQELRRLRLRRKRLIERLPAISEKPASQQTMAETWRTTQLRAKQFFRSNDFFTMDLQRSIATPEGEQGLILNTQLDALLCGYEARPDLYTVKRNDYSPQTTTIHVALLDEAMANYDMLYLAQNIREHTTVTQKSAYTYAGRQEIVNHFALRHEYILRFDLLDKEQRKAVAEMLFQHGEAMDSAVFTGGGMADETMFWSLSELIEDNHPAILPLASTSYVYRDRPIATQPFRPMPELARYPALAAARAEHGKKYETAYLNQTA